MLEKSQFDKVKKKVWYGRLKTQSANTPVIYDPTLAEAPAGRIYLFNGDRNSIIQYSEQIVVQLLEEVDSAEQKQIKASLENPWKAARKEFMRQHKNPLIPAKADATTVQKKLADDLELGNEETSVEEDMVDFDD